MNELKKNTRGHCYGFRFNTFFSKFDIKLVLRKTRIGIGFILDNTTRSLNTNPERLFIFSHYRAVCCMFSVTCPKINFGVGRDSTTVLLDLF